MYASKLISLLSAAFPQLIPLMANKSDLNSIWVTALDNYTSVFLLLPNEAAFHTEADCKPKCNIAHFYLILWYFIFCSPPLTSLCRNLIINIDNTARSWGRRKTNNSISNVLLILYAFAVLSIKKKNCFCFEPVWKSATLGIRLIGLLTVTVQIYWRGKGESLEAPPPEWMKVSSTTVI